VRLNVAVETTRLTWIRAFIQSRYLDGYIPEAIELLLKIA
jgi:hypothetical protein